MKKSNSITRLPPQISDIPFFKEFLDNLCTSADFDFADELVFEFELAVANHYGKQIGCSSLGKNLISEMHIKNQEYLNSGFMKVNVNAGVGL